MTGEILRVTTVFPLVVIGWTLLAIPVMIASLIGIDPAGRAGGAGVGIRINARVTWFVVELMALATFATAYLADGNPHLVGNVVFLLWTAHFGHRAFVWTWRVLPRDSTVPVTMGVAAMLFTGVHGALIGTSMVEPTRYGSEWLTDPRFVLGLAVVVGGAGLNVWSDYRLLALRRRDPGRPVMPAGRPFNVVACPNHLGEIIEWIGFAVLTWSLAGLALAVWAVANLVPRALWRRDWYRRTFADYPRRRSAVVPGLL